MSYGGTADATGIQVTFLDQTGAKSVYGLLLSAVWPEPSAFMV